MYAGVLGTLLTNQNKLNYVNFYADLEMLVDQHIAAIMSKLDARGLTDSTVVVRLSDHGEMGLSHGGLRQKMFNAYEETIHVPLVISNPVMFPTPVESAALVSLVDVMPTLATLASVPERSRFHFKGFDLTPLIANPTGAVQDTILFTFDDDRAGTGWVSPNIADKPHHIRAILFKDTDGEWKYARYFNPEGGVSPQYEMYHLADAEGNPVDANETNNLVGNPDYAAKQAILDQKLAQVETERLNPLYFQYLPALQR